jgi:hypothetical protein
MEFLSFLFPMLYSVPYYLLWLAGIAYAFVRRERHPRTSLVAGLALGILLLETFVSDLLTAQFQYQAITGSLSTGEITARFSTLTLCTFPFSILGWILLLIAIFGWKKPVEEEGENDHEDENILL